MRRRAGYEGADSRIMKEPSDRQPEMLEDLLRQWGAENAERSAALAAARPGVASGSRRRIPWLRVAALLVVTAGLAALVTWASLNGSTPGAASLAPEARRLRSRVRTLETLRKEQDRQIRELQRKIAELEINSPAARAGRLEQELRRLQKQHATLRASHEQVRRSLRQAQNSLRAAYLGRTAPGKTGFAALRQAAISDKLAERAAEATSAAQSKEARKVIQDAQSAIALLVAAPEAEKPPAELTLHLRRSELLRRTDELLGREDLGEAVRAWLAEAHLVLTGIGK
jgi:hypothetical protein